MGIIRASCLIFILLLPYYLIAQQLSPMLLTSDDSFPSSIYPQGWSTDGYFAYQFIAQLSNKLADIGFVIVDTRTDAELFTYTEQNIELTPQSLTSFSNRHKTLIEQTLKRYKIVRNAGQYRGISFDDFITTIDINYVVGSPLNFTVTLTKHNSKKIVAVGSLKKGSSNLTLVTAIQSPFEQRIAIISVAGYQNNSYKKYGHPVVFGAHLLSGFS